MIAVADENMTGVAETFGRHMTVRALPGRAIRHDDLNDADVLLVRSITRVDAELLEGTPVRFVGSATIGTDHMDTEWLDQQGIHWAAAPGCNADAAAQYTLGMILLALRRLGRELAGARVGVIGRGHVGSHLVKLLAPFGAHIVACDPPLQEAGMTGLVSFENALDSDIISLHVPFTDQGAHPTQNLMDGAAFHRMRENALLVNTSRGRVIDGGALRVALASGKLQAALDVWPEEPDIDDALLDMVCVATPHVAGYSAAGKHRGTFMVYAAWRAFSGLEALSPWETGDDPVRITTAGNAPNPLENAVMAVTCVREDDQALRACAPVNRERFDALRRGYRHRAEFADAIIAGAPARATETLDALGFRPAPQADPE